ncbi:hypothetical protein BBJ28_00019535 [Nothophytophthora sp. Chile5]|nr:hypothetical protein BBJ28_00019535 [Nothophytophthora sp. Chile5]
MPCYGYHRNCHPIGIFRDSSQTFLPYRPHLLIPKFAMGKASDGEVDAPILPRRVHRADVIAREELNKVTDFTVVKTTLNQFCKSKARALPWDEVLADMNKGVLEAYLLANVHVLRLCKAGLPIPPLNNTFFNQCLSLVMEMSGARGPKNDVLLLSRDVYNSFRDPTTPRASRQFIHRGWVHNAANQMATMTQNAVSLNFYRRFHKFLKRKYGVDGREAYSLLERILDNAYDGQDAVVLEWRAQIPRTATGAPKTAAHLLVPLTYRFLQDIEERNRISQVNPEFRQMRTFTVLPTKRGFECSHMKMCKLGLRSLLQRAGIRVPPEGPKWNAVKRTYWRRLFNIKKFETANRKFAGQIVTDGKAVSIVMRKPKREPAPEQMRLFSASEFDVMWGLDPGRRDLFVATNQLGETVSCSTKEFYEEARYTKAKQKIKGWQDRSPRVLEAIRNMPTKKSASLETLGYYIRFMTKRMDLLLGFAQRKPFRRLRLRSFIFMKRKLRQLCLMLAREGERTVVGFGDWSNQDVAGIIKKSPAGPVKRFERELARYCTVISIAEFRTSKVHFDCERELKNQYSQRLCWDGEIRTQKVHSVLHCSSNGCRGITVDRDVNASRNMLRLLQCKLNSIDRPVAYTRQART